MNHSIRQDRRAFLRNLQIMLAGGAAVSILPQLELVGRALATSAATGDYRALVCIFLYGGNDSFNMLIPYSQSEYNLYDASRGGVYNATTNPFGLGIARDQLLTIKDTANTTWGLHPACAEMKTLFTAGELAFVANVGPLVQPVTKDQVVNNSAPLPAYLYSHADQQPQWMRGYSGSANAGTGWGGLTADRIAAFNTGYEGLPPSISISGNNLFQFGQSTLPFAMTSAGPALLEQFRIDNNHLAADKIRRAALDELIDAAYTPVMQEGYGVISDSAIVLNDVLGDVLDPDNGGDITTIFPVGSNLGSQLRMIARMIKASQTPTLAQSRQIYFASLGGFDTHKEQMLDTGHSAKLADLSQSLSAFRAALVEIGALNDVTTFTMSDFGRTLNSNGDGSDHAWGGVQLVMGGANTNGGSLQGKKIWGTYPLLELNGAQSLERGQMVPTTSVSQVGSALSYWLGANDSDLSLIFPGIENFSPQRLGILG